jgi:cytochrome c oxidase cbb3-type subunit I/II
MTMLGVPYGSAVSDAPQLARAQANTIAGDLASTGGRSGLETKEVVALIAYLQRLGRDIQGADPAVSASRPAAAAPGGQP